MADEGKLVSSAQILPDELVRIISSITYTYTPVAGDAWYYRLTNVPITSPVDLIKIGDSYLQGSTTAAGTDAASSAPVVATGDAFAPSALGLSTSASSLFFSFSFLKRFHLVILISHYRYHLYINH